MSEETVLPNVTLNQQNPYSEAFTSDGIAKATLAPRQKFVYAILSTYEWNPQPRLTKSFKKVRIVTCIVHHAMDVCVSNNCDIGDLGASYVC